MMGAMVVLFECAWFLNECYRYLIPFMISQATAAVMFLYFGYCLRYKNIKSRIGKWYLLPLYLGLIGFTWYYNIRLSMCSFIYPCNIINIVSSILLCCLFFAIVKKIAIRFKDNRVSKVVELLGRNTLAILCLHNLDLSYGISKYIFDNYLYTTIPIPHIIFILDPIQKVTFVCLGLLLLNKIPLTRNIYKIRIK